MALYYYAKYALDEIHDYSNPDSSWSLVPIGYNPGKRAGYASVGFSSGETGFYTYGEYYSEGEINYPPYYTYRVYTGGQANQYMNLPAGTNGVPIDHYFTYEKECDDDPDYEKGSYITTVIAEDGTYPDDGIQSGYWWVKGSIAVPTLYIKVGGVWKLTTGLYTKVGGVWKTVNTSYIKIGGAWEQSD